MITDNPDQTKHIVQSILTQALEQGYSSGWMITEIQFEAQGWTAGDRVSLVRRKLAERRMDDAALDTYNDRLNRKSIGLPF